MPYLYANDKSFCTTADYFVLIKCQSEIVTVKLIPLFQIVNVLADTHTATDVVNYLTSVITVCVNGLVLLLL